MDIKTNDIVQITDEKHHWFPALIIVSEPKSWGVQGYLHVVNNDPAEPNGQAYIRLDAAQYEKVGHAIVVIHGDDDQ